MDKIKLATERVNKARAELIMSHTFYGVLISNVDAVPSSRFPTMATDGRRHFFNPDFIAGLTQKQLLGVQRHESEHDARRHHTRREGRDPKEWNIATDFAINIDLVDEGVELPEGALVDAKYRGWSAEDIYRARELDRQGEEQKRQQEQQQAGDDGEQGDEQADSDAGEQEPDEADDQGDDAGNGADDQGDQGEDGQERAELGGGDADEQGEEEGQDGDQASGEAAGEPGEGEPTEDAGNGGNGDGKPSEGEEARQGSAGEVGPGEATPGRARLGMPSRGEADAQEGGEDQTSSPTADDIDPGRCGATIDAADDAADLSAEDSRWERVLRQAAMLSSKRGDQPGHVSREIERADRPPKNWREELRKWIDGGAKSIETWQKPNRRFCGGGLYLPGRQRDGINRVVMLVDTSGSMDNIALNCINVEMQAALDEGAIDELVVVYGDTRVTRVDTYHNGDEIEFDPRGGGGTELRPLFNYVRDEIEDPSLIVCFTDGYIDNVAAGGEPPADVLWAYTGYPDVVRQMIANAPWGAPAIDVGSH